MIKIMVVDEDALIRKGVISVLKAEKDFDVVAEAATGAAAVKFAIDLKPDIIIMDMLLPDINGIKAAKTIKEKKIESEIIFLTMSNDTRLQMIAQKAGVRGFLLKSDAINNLIYAIRAILRGEQFMSGSLMTVEFPRKSYYRDFQLSPRETEIVTLIAEGMNSKEIAEKLFISHRTVETHRNNIMGKLDVRNMAEIVNYALRTGIIE